MRTTTLAAAMLLAAVAAPAAEKPNLTFDSSSLLQLEPLVITAPRVRAQKDLIDPRINQHLLRLLQNRMNARPDTIASLDASVGNLSKLTTMTGYNLKTRYTELGFLLTEGLAGTTDFTLQNELEKVVKFGNNVQTRAAALIALAYTKDMRWLSLFQGALIDPSVTVRFAAVEALLVLGDPIVQVQVGQAARADASLPVQVFAAAGLWRLGDIYGRELLLRFIAHNDWFVRALAAHYLGELGGEYEHQKLLREFQFEKDPVTQAEMAGALLKIQARLEKK
ncbi:MAG: HEAT repeat domain-containing protein [Elusimicrobiota bacterium]|nr:HEAT repeat domain-containing protein [Elusimicrobiota bacterium]